MNFAHSVSDSFTRSRITAIELMPCAASTFLSVRKHFLMSANSGLWWKFFSISLASTRCGRLCAGNFPPATLAGKLKVSSGSRAWATFPKSSVVLSSLSLELLGAYESTIAVFRLD